MNPIEQNPMAPQDLHVLLALSDAPRHGYGIMKATEDAGAPVELGSLYRIISRLLRSGWIVESRAGAAAAPSPGKPRRAYELTALGRSTLRAELARLRSLLERPEAEVILAEGDR